MRSLSFIVVATAFALLGVTIAAQSVDPALTAAMAARDKAAIARDVAGVAQYTADDYASINPTGTLMNKQQRLDGLKVPANPSATPQSPLRTEAVHMYGGAAVVRSRTVDGRQLHVWVRNPKGWQVAAIHISPDAVIAPPPTADRPKTAQPTALPAPAGLSGDRAAVFGVFKQMQDAFYAGDRATYEKLTAPEFARISAGGMVRFGNENSAAIDGPRAHPKFSNISVQVWEQVAAVRWLETNAAGQQQWLTRVMVKKPSGWQQVATASSAAAKGSGS